MSHMPNFLNREDLQDLISFIVFDHKVIGPRFAEIHLTDRCNSNCYFCNQKDLRKKAEDFVLDDLKRLISQLSDYGLKAVRFSGGGDPTQYSHLEDVLKFIKNLGIRVNNFDTNGIQLTPDISKLLISCGLNILHISMQAPTKETWSKVTGRNTNDFDIVLENIREFKRIDKNNSVEVYASFMIDMTTYDKIMEMEKLCKELKIGLYIHELNSFQYSEYFKSHYIPKIENQISQVHIHDLNRRVLTSFLHSFYQDTDVRIKEMPPRCSVCYAPWIGILIKPNGDIYPCCPLQINTFIMGNVYKENFIDIWTGDKYKKFRQLGNESFFGVTFQTSAEIKDMMDVQFHNRCVVRNCPIKNGFFSMSDLDDIIYELIWSKNKST